LIRFIVRVLEPR